MSTGWDLSPEFDEGIYAGTADTLLDIIRLSSPAEDTVLVVGHNPTLATLAQVLVDGEGDQSAEVSMTVGFPPASAAIFEVSQAWTDLAAGTCRLKAFHVGSTEGN